MNERSYLDRGYLMLRVVEKQKVPRNPAEQLLCVNGDESEDETATTRLLV